MQQKKIQVKTPAKINLSLEIIDRFENGFHSLSSVMQTVSLYDYLTFQKTEISGENQIILQGNSTQIPYDENNIIYKVIKSYFEKIQANGIKIEVNIEKNIPTQAGLAGGSTNAAGALIAINSLFNNELSKEEIHNLAAKAGSDLNFCLEGGACLLSSRGEIIEEKLPYQKINIIIAKPLDISVSTPLCYKEFSKKYFEKKELFKSNNFSAQKLSEILYNDLEKPAIDMHFEIQKIKEQLIQNGCINSLMSGSGSAIFGIFEKEITKDFDKNIQIYELETTPNGVQLL